MQATREVECQVCEFDLTPEFIFGPTPHLNDISSISEDEVNESTNNICLLSGIIKNLNKELLEQERTIDLQHQQIKILKETIKNLERKHSFERAYEDKIGPHSEHLKISICKLISQIPKLPTEGEGLVTLILSLLFLTQGEMSDIQEIRNSKNPRNLMCFLADKR
jgi:uncharacterized coiled-coil protein SlyX